MPEANEAHRYAERHNLASAGKTLHIDPPTGHLRDVSGLNTATLIAGRSLCCCAVCQAGAGR